MSYVNDNAEVRETKNNLESAIFDKKIGELDDQIDSLNKQIDEINEKYDELIKQTEEFYDEQIKGIEEMIDKWEELQHMAEMVENIKALSQLGITIDDVLSGNVDFDSLKNNYMAIVGGLEGMDAAAQAAGTNMESLSSTLDSMLGYHFEDMGAEDLASDLNDVADNAGKAARALGSGGGTPTADTAGGSKTDSSNKTSSSTGSTTESSGGGTLAEGLQTVGDKKSDIDELSNAFGDEGLAGNIQTVIDKIGDESNEESLIGKFGLLKTASEDIPDKVVQPFSLLNDAIAGCVWGLEQMISKMQALKESGSVAATAFVGAVIGGGPVSYSGTAYANGNWSAKSKGVDGNALVGELGTEIKVDSKTGRWETIGNNGAEFTKVRPGDIIFNHKQSEELLKNGRINSRGKAYASGKDNIFSPLSSEEMSKYNLNLTKDLAEKLEFGNQKLINIDKNVASINNTSTTNNNNPVFNISNEFTCNGVSLADVQAELVKAFEGIFAAAYQKSMTN